MTHDDIRLHLKERMKSHNETWKFYADKAYLRVGHEMGSEIRIDSDAITFPYNPNTYIPDSIASLDELLDNADNYIWKAGPYSDSYEYLELFYPFEPNDIWRMAVTKSERTRAILDRVYDRLEVYLGDLVEHYRNELPFLRFDKWYFERRRHTESVRNAIAFYDPSDNSIHFSLSSFMYGELALRMTVLHEMCHVKYCNHKGHFWRLLYETARQVGLKEVSYHRNVKPSSYTVLLPTNMKIDYTETVRRQTVSRKKRNVFSPEIAKHRYLASPEVESLSVKAKQIADSINYCDYMTPKFDQAMETLWEYVNSGSLNAAILLSDILNYGMKYHNKDNLHIFYILQEKMLNMGYHKLSDLIEDNFYFGNNVSHKYDIDDLDNLIAEGSGLACINKADWLIYHGKNLNDAIVLYRTAAERGYSVGWRILYCIHSFLKDKMQADRFLALFSAAATLDSTNWRWIEIKLLKRPYTQCSLSILSKQPQTAKLMLNRIYHN